MMSGRKRLDRVAPLIQPAKVGDKRDDDAIHNPAYFGDLVSEFRLKQKDELSFQSNLSKYHIFPYLSLVPGNVTCRRRSQWVVSTRAAGLRFAPGALHLFPSMSFHASVLRMLFYHCQYYTAMLPILPTDPPSSDF